MAPALPSGLSGRSPPALRRAFQRACSEPSPLLAGFSSRSPMGAAPYDPGGATSPLRSLVATPRMRPSRYPGPPPNCMRSDRVACDRSTADAMAAALACSAAASDRRLAALARVLASTNWLSMPKKLLRVAERAAARGGRKAAAATVESMARCCGAVSNTTSGSR